MVWPPVKHRDFEARGWLLMIAANAIESGQPQGQRVICAQTTHFWRAQTNPEPKNKTIEP